MSTSNEKSCCGAESVCCSTENTCCATERDCRADSSCCSTDNSCCGDSCCCDAHNAGAVDAKKELPVEYLYLDLETCERCAGTGRELEEVLRVLTPALELAGFAVSYRKIEMTTRELAEQYRFVSSPTVRVNGQDICAAVEENFCRSCGEICNSQIDCRVFRLGGELYEIAPKELLASRILELAFAGAACDCDDGCGCDDSACACGCDGGGDDAPYEMPENLKLFYGAKKAKGGCSCCGRC